MSREIIDGSDDTEALWYTQPAGDNDPILRACRLYGYEAVARWVAEETGHPFERVLNALYEFGE